MRRCRSCLKVSQQSAVLLYATHYGEALRPRRDTSVEEVSIRPARRLHTGQYARSERTAQRALHCRCGRGKVLALGMCATCYTLKRQDEAYFGGLREQVLKRDGYCCRACGASGRGKRSIVVHHRVPGVSRLHLMISLCSACHAIVSRTRFMRRSMLPLLWNCGGNSTRKDMNRRS